MNNLLYFCAVNNKLKEKFMEELSIDNIMTGDEVDTLFTPVTEEPTQGEEPPKGEGADKSTTEEEVDIDDLFNLESVGSGKTHEESGEKPESEHNDGSSPKTDNFYSSIAKACKEEGIFPNLDDESLDVIKSADDFREAMNKQIQAALDEKQRMISEALDSGVEPDDIQKYQSALDYLESITDDAVKDEAKGVALRKQLIYNDFINRGLSEERATKLTQRSFDQGTDIEDALEARNSNKDFIGTKYKEVVEEAKKQAAAVEAKEKEKAESIKKTIMETEEPFEGIKLDKNTRQRVFDTISKPIFKDKEGNMYTAIQKAQHDDEEGFIRKLGYIFTLTNGFKDLDSLVKGKVQKETKKGFQKLDQVLRTPSTSGEPKFMSGVGVDIDSGDPGLVLDTH